MNIHAPLISYDGRLYTVFMPIIGITFKAIATEINSPPENVPIASIIVRLAMSQIHLKCQYQLSRIGNIYDKIIFLFSRWRQASQLHLVMGHYQFFNRYDIDIFYSAIRILSGRNSTVCFLFLFSLYGMAL